MNAAQFQTIQNALIACQQAQAAVDAEQPKMNQADQDLLAKRNAWYAVVMNPAPLIQPFADAMNKAQSARDTEFAKMAGLQEALQKAEINLTAATNPSLSSSGSEITTN